MVSVKAGTRVHLCLVLSLIGLYICNIIFKHGIKSKLFNMAFKDLLARV